MTAAVELPGGAEADGLWSPSRRRLTTGLVLSVTLLALEALSVATVLPAVQEDLDDLGLYGWVFSAFFLASLVGTVLAGAAADRRGPAVPFAAGMALFTVGLVVAGLAPSMLVLVVGRAVQGLGAGVVPAVAYVALGRGVPEALRPRMLALMSSAWVVPSLLGPGLSALVAETVGWRWVFLGLLPFMALGAALAIPALSGLPAGEPGDRGPSRLPDALAVTAGAGLVVAGLARTNASVAVAMVAVGVAIGLPAFSRLVPSGTLRARSGIPAAVLVRGVLTFAFFAADAYVPLLVADLRDGGVALGGLVVTTATVTWTTGSWVQARHADLGPRRLVGIGLVLLVAGTLLMACVLADAVPVAVAFPAWALAGLGIGLAYSPLSLAVIDGAEAGSEGRAAAGLQLSDVLGIALGTGAGGAAVAAGDALGWSGRTGPGIAFALAAAVGTIGVVLARRLPAQARLPS